MTGGGWAGVARMGGIGDNLLAASALRPLKRMGYKTEMITSPSAQVVFQNNPFLDKLSVKPDGSIPASVALLRSAPCVAGGFGILLVEARVSPQTVRRLLS